MRKLTKSIALLALAIPCIINAGSKSGLNPTRIRINKDFAGPRTFQVNNGEYLDNGCQNSDIWLSGSEESKKSILAVLLTARSGGLTITINYTISGGYCYVDDVYLD